MDENDVLQLVQRWQDPGTWRTVETLATRAADFETQADKLGSDARLMLDRRDVPAAQELKAESDHLRKCAAIVRGQRAERADEFSQIEHWVREHRPELLEFVPVAQFDGDPLDAIRDLKRLESLIRKPATTTAIDAAVDDEPLAQDGAFTAFHPRGDWWPKFGKGRSWFNKRRDGWIDEGILIVDPKARTSGGIAFRRDWLATQGIQEPTTVNDG